VSNTEPKDLADTLFGVTRQLRWHVNERMRAAGVSLARFRVLDLLTEGPQRMRDLSTALEVAPRTITGLVDALESYNTSLRLAPELADAHYNAARLHEQLGDAKKALRHLNAYRRLERPRR
jgi:tetratricopeptide (TPR) repeat protein